MLYALSTSELMDRPDLWQAVHSLRHSIFVDEMGWEDLRRPDGLEMDQFDHDEATHHLVIRNGELAGYQRMLPTTRPHLLTEVLTDLYEGTPPRGPDIYELTRYAVARPFREGRWGVSSVGSELIAGFIEWGMERAQPLGYQRTYGRQQVVATLLTFDDTTLRVVREKRNYDAPVLVHGEPDLVGYRKAS
jgi:acyl-homoserine lactone synthase